MKRPSYDRQQTRNAGFSLLEVLVTILVLSFGLLGMANLILTGMRSNNIAHYRGIATQQTHDMADRMRANLVGVSAGHYDALATGIPASNDCIATNCSAAQMAVYDHAQWNAANGILLPDGVGTVVGNLAGGFLVTVMWVEKEMNGVTDPACPSGTPADRRCFSSRFSP